MKVIQQFILVLTLLVCVLPGLQAMTTQDAQLFQSATDAYRSEQFAKAIESYEELLEKYPTNSEILYNLGNAYYRNKQIGQAVLSYEKARIYNPRNQDAYYNLKFVTSQLEYNIKDTRNWYLKALEFLINLFTHQEVIFFMLAAYFLFAASWAFVLFFRGSLPWGWIRKSFLSLFVISLVLAGIKNIQAYVVRDAIVTAKEAEIRFGPSSSDKLAFRLGEGLKVYVVDHQQDWSRVLLANGESGWVKNSQIAEVFKS